MEVCRFGLESMAQVLADVASTGGVKIGIQYASCKASG